MQKYYKYKNKYLDLENGFSNPDKGDGYDSDDLEYVPDEELELDEIPEVEADGKVEDMALKLDNFEGFDIDPGTDFISENLQQGIFDVGMFGKARGKVYKFDQFDDNNFIKIDSKANKFKILLINDKNSFDDFTDKYGYINKKDKNLYIKWDQVHKNYKGIYIASSALDDREDTVPFKEKTVKNWVDYDFNHLDDVIIFKKYRSLIHQKEITKPFNGHVVDSYGIDESEFVKISDPITNDKILLIDDIKAFDKFTRKYGVVTPDRDKSFSSFISIKWHSVNNDYDGICIDTDQAIKKNRYGKAFLNDKLYDSWWEKSEIAPGVVYLFK